MSSIKRPSSLKRELITWYVISFVLMMAASNLLLYYILRSAVQADRSSILNDRLRAIANLLKTPERGRAELEHRIIEEWPGRRGELIAFQIVDGSGQVILETPNFTALGFSASDLNRMPEMTGAAKTALSSTATQISTTDGHLFLQETKFMANSIGLKDPVKVFGAIDDEPGEIFLRLFRQSVGATVLLSVFISLILGWQITKRGLLPLLAITEAVKKIGTHTLHSRIKLESLPEEILPLAIAFNQTLARLDESFSKLSRFSSDIAHELRTPVTNILGELEVNLRKPRSENEYREILTSTLEECTRLRQVIESLLFLARAENLEPGVNVQKLNVHESLTNIVDFFEASASDAGISLQLVSGESTPLWLKAEKTLFQQAIGNLLSNAIRHTPSGGFIEIQTEAIGTNVKISIRDSGTGIQPEHLPHVLDRFYRVDSSRDHSTGGVGLGLAITKSIVDLHQGEIEIQSVGQRIDQRIGQSVDRNVGPVSAGSGTTVILTWPMWSASSSSLQS